MKKNTVWLAVAAGIVGFGVFTLNACKNSSSEQGSSEVKIGVTAALSGPVAFWGQSTLEGMQLAADEYSGANPDHPAKIVFEDNAGEAKNSIATMRKLCTSDKASCVVSVLTPYSKPLRPIAAQLQTPLLGAVVASLNFGAENEWSFRDYPTPDQLCARMAAYAYKTLGFRKPVSLVVNDEYGTDSLKVFQKSFEELGSKLLGSDTVMQTDTDMRAQVTKLIQLGPDCVFLVIRENALGTAVRQFRELGFKGQILGINAFDSPVVWQACGPHGEGIIFTNVLIDYDGNAEAAAFAKAFAKRYNKDPNNTAAYGYSIAKYLLPLAVQSKGDGKKMRELLSTLETTSLRGPIKMQTSRDVLTAVATYKRQGDKNIIIER
jgi:branched-chain amino acid transport system substrate-binding protein